MMDFIYGMGNYPYQALWMEYNHPVTVDDAVSYEGAIPFRYRKVAAKVMKVQDVNGLKDVKYENVIRTKSSLRFKAKDQVKIGEKIYSIHTVNSVESEALKESKTFLPGFDDMETELILE